MEASRKNSMGQYIGRHDKMNYDERLNEMINRFDTVPAPELNLDVNDHMAIYNWLKDLALYKKLYGELKK